MVQPQGSSEKKYPAWIDMVAGVGGGVLSKSLLSPFQRIVVLQQLGQHRDYSVWEIVRQIYHNDGGIRGFWRGNLTAMIIRVPYSGIQFLLYSRLKFFLQDWLTQRKAAKMNAFAETGVSFEKFIIKCGAGGLSATIAGAIVYPGEVVRLRLMSGEKRFSGIFTTCRLIYNETNSVRHFYRGLNASLIQRVPDILVSFATYETIKYALLDNPNAIVFKDNYEARNVLATVVAGALAALASIAVAFPLDVAKRRIGMSGQGTESIVYSGIGNCLKCMYHKEGIRGWYAGSMIEAMRCMPQVVLMWFFIEGIQKELEKNFGTLRE